jgi:hypothetical protein
MVLGPQFLSDPDVQWHTATGQWIIEHGAVPRVDVFSYSAAGRPWINMEWLSQVVMALAFDCAGYNGLVALASLTVALTFILMVHYLREAIDPWAAILVAFSAVWFASFHFLMRPHMLAFPVLVIWTGELSRAAVRTVSVKHKIRRRKGGAYPLLYEHFDRTPWYLLPLMVVWVNLHGSFVLGPVIAVGLGFPLLGVAAAAAALVNPYGWGYYDMVLWQYHNMDVLRATIAELRPVNAYTDAPRVAALIAGLCMLLWRGIQLPLLRAGLLCGLLFMGLQHWRGLSFFAIAAPMVVLCTRSQPSSAPR